MSVMDRRQIDKALNRDVAALLALFLQIYGGDPPPDQVEVSVATDLLAAALVTQLTAELKLPALSEDELNARLGRLGLRLGDREEHREGAIRIIGGWTCITGPEGEPGCCIRLPVHVVGGPGEGTDNP